MDVTSLIWTVLQTAELAKSCQQSMALACENFRSSQIVSGVLWRKRRERFRIDSYTSVAWELIPVSALWPGEG